MKTLRILFACTMLATMTLGLTRVVSAAEDETKEAVKKVVKATDAAALLEAKERQIQDAFKSRDAAGFMLLVDANGWNVDPMGLSPVSKVPDMMKSVEIKSYTMDEFKTIMVDHDAYIATYTWKGDATMNGQPYPPGPWYCTTVWAKKGKDWKAVFHQETLAMQPPAGSTEGH